MSSTLATAAAAQVPSAAKVGPNGGQITVADGHPIEFVGTDKEMVFFLKDEEGKPLDTKGVSARAVIQSGGKTETVTLNASAPNKLVGPLSAPLGAGAKVVLSTKVHGHSLQARFSK
ncbi:hypothetical protein CRT23_20740 [Methylobacterium sp. V23]|nr:hypothetical protein CRT23_20740 [Methylobacterium sp. V23]